MTREPDFDKNMYQKRLGMMIQKHIKYLEYQLVMQKQNKKYSFTKQHQG